MCLRLAAGLLLALTLAVTVSPAAEAITYGESPGLKEQNEKEAKEVANRENERETHEREHKEQEAASRHSAEETERQQKANEQKAAEEAAQRHAAEEVAANEAAERKRQAEEALASHCVVPSLTGDSLKAATKALSKAHCRLGKVTSSRNQHGAVVVIRQSSKRGTELARGAHVAVTLGPKPRRS